MNYHCLIIGGGLSGLVCGIKCAKEGLRTAIISNGMSSLHLSSGSIDLFSYSARNREIENVFDYLKKNNRENPHHPYSKIGLNTIKKSLDFFKNELEYESLNYYKNGTSNHHRITGLGIFKPTYMSPVSIYNDRVKDALRRSAKISMLNFDGYRDYFPGLAVNELKKNKMLKGAEIKTGIIKLPGYDKREKNIFEFRSIDLARIFDTEKFLPNLADQIRTVSGEAEIAVLPNFIGLDNYQKIHEKLEKMTGKIIIEVPALPPSITGMRLENRLKSRFAALGGEFSLSDNVTDGKIEDREVQCINTLNYKKNEYRSKFYVLSSGSFYSGGLKSEFNRIKEPVFNLLIEGDQLRNRWYSEKFINKKSHPFFQYGVKTNRSLNPFFMKDKTVKNLFCTGAILSGYDPIKEGSGGGVAISTGYYAALKIIKGM